MKKVLLASTALVAFAGAAAADDNPNISISGNAEMGISGGSVNIDFDGGGSSDTRNPAQFHQNVDLTFSMTGETDGGLSFGVSVDLDEAAGITGSEHDDHGVAVFISGDFGTLTMGDTDGAMDRVLTEAGNIGNPGSLNDAETGHLGYNGDYLDGSGDGQVVRYDYSFDAFSFAISVEQHGNGSGTVVDADDAALDTGDDLTWAIGFGYSFDFAGGSVDLGLGYQYSDNGKLNLGSVSESSVGDLNGDNDTDDSVNIFPQLAGGVGETSTVGISAVVNLDSGLSAGLVYHTYDFDDFDDGLQHVGLGVGYSFDAFSVHFNYGQWSTDDFTATGFGLAAAYDLGGGASLKFGYGNSSTDDADFNGDGNADDYSASSYSLGLAFSF